MGTKLTFKQKWQVIFPPTAGTIILGTLYMLVRPTLNIWIKGDEGAMTSGTIAVLGMLYAIVGTYAVFEVLRQWNTVYGAYKLHDQKTFEAYVDVRLPWHVKLAWAITSVFLLVSFVLTYWHNNLTAAFTVSGVAFTVIFWWRVASDLDDYFTGVWNIPPIPDGWWKEK